MAPKTSYSRFLVLALLSRGLIAFAGLPARLKLAPQLETEDDPFVWRESSERHTKKREERKERDVKWSEPHTHADLHRRREASRVCVDSVNLIRRGKVITCFSLSSTCR